MTDRPIIFSAPMMRALLEERKTQTRRILKHRDPERRAFVQTCPAAKIVEGWVSFGHPMGGPGTCIRLPVALGDRLWVRETWQTGMGGDGPQIAYRATPDFVDINAWDGEDQGAGPSFNYDRCPGASWHTWLPDLLSGAEGSWRSPIHMPRWASRLTLTVSGVRVQRLQEISEEDAEAEGLSRAPGGCWSGAEGQAGTTPKAAYAVLWNSLHGPEAWAANPWVVAITFTVERRNIDVAAPLAGTKQNGMPELRP